MEERIVLVDKIGKKLGTAPKLASHHANTPLHQAFSCYVFSPKGQFLLTQRALVKKVWPGVWTNTVCGHPGPGEAAEAAVKRRLKQELGIDKVSKLTLVDADYRYKTPPFNGIIENELAPIYVATASEEPKPNPDEVEAYKWVKWDEALKDIEQNPEIYSYWFKDQLKILAANPRFQAFLAALH